MTGELGAILSYVDQLNEVEVDGVAPTAHVHLSRLALRRDETQASLGVDRVLAGAPAHDGNGFVVPTFVDEG